MRQPTSLGGGLPAARRPIDDLDGRLAELVVGQREAIETIVPYVELFEAGLAPEGRPVGVFLLLGPTGTGKTRTVEALAEVLHGSPKNVLRIDCGEFQLEHEVAKLIGAPPGYLGHRETTPMLTQQKLNAAASADCGLSLVLLDEVEKAAGSLARLLLGVFDKAALRLGDNTTVNFERAMIFLTSNLGAREMLRTLGGSFGFAGLPGVETGAARRLARIGLNAVRRRFSPEFVNRIDRTITYFPLDRDACEAILDHQLAALNGLLRRRLAERAFTVELAGEAREFLLNRGVSREHGARELKRVVHRRLLQPLARLVRRGAVEPGAVVRAEAEPGGESLRLEVGGPRPQAEAAQAGWE